VSDRRTLSLTIVALLALAAAMPFAHPGQAPAPGLQKTHVDIERRVDAMLAQLTLEEKVGLLGGVDGYFVPGAPKLSLPGMKTSDGPAGPQRRSDHDDGGRRGAGGDMNEARPRVDRDRARRGRAGSTSCSAPVSTCTCRR
jgi:hypothetical protein